MTTKRQIIAIAIDPGNDRYMAIVHALCNDGSTWVRRVMSGAEWERQPDIPQPDEEEVSI
jgi:hypothetical protein